jgi:hypothetical protein
MSNAGSLGASAQELNSVAASGFMFRNRLINGDMRIDQRRNGASLSVPLGFANYTLDRWNCQASQSNKVSVQQNAGSVTPPDGFTNYLGVTSLSAYTAAANEYFAIMQSIEGYNVADFNFGKSSAKAITASFWVRSSLTGTHSGAVLNSDGSRGYAFTFSISAANTWEYKTVTIPGDTTGTWNTTNGAGLMIRFDLGSGSSFRFSPGSWGAFNPNGATGAVSVIGTNGATFYVTGVQVEPGSVATPFERRPYDEELARCRRYHEQTDVLTGYAGACSAIGVSVSAATGQRFMVPKRATPTVVIYNRAGTANKVANIATGVAVGTTVTAANIGVYGFQSILDSGSGFTAGTIYELNYSATSEI